MHISPRPELSDVVTCYHGGLRLEEIEALGLSKEARSAIIDFSVNTNPIGPSPAVKAALADVDVQRYPDSEATILREELSGRLGISASNLVVGNGSVELIWLTCLAYLAKGDTVLILGPTFGEYETASRIMGAHVIFYVAREGDDYRPDLDEVGDTIGQVDAKLIFLCNPNNPTGCYLQKEEVERIISAAGKSLVVIDEAYASLADSSWASEELIRHPNVLLLRSMTKDLALAGLRLGYALANDDVIDILRKVRPPWSANSFAQAAAIASLRDRDYLERSRLEIRTAKEYLVPRLKELGLTVIPSQANFLLMKVGDASTFRGKLLRKGFCLRDCSSFGLKDYVRIGIRTQTECRDLAKAIREVLEFD